MRTCARLSAKSAITQRQLPSISADCQAARLDDCRFYRGDKIKGTAVRGTAAVPWD